MGWQRHKVAAEINPVHASHTHCSRAYATPHATVQPSLIAGISLTIVFFHTITSGFYVIHVYCTCFDVAFDCQKWYLIWCKENLSLLYTFNWHWLGIYSYLSKSMVFDCFSLYDHVYCKIYIELGVIDPAESESGLIFDLKQLLSCHLGCLCREFSKTTKANGTDCLAKHACVSQRSSNKQSLHLNSVMSYHQYKRAYCINLQLQ